MGHHSTRLAGSWSGFWLKFNETDIACRFFPILICLTIVHNGLPEVFARFEQALWVMI
jgi:hypothetical protein